MGKVIDFPKQDAAPSTMDKAQAEKKAVLRLILQKHIDDLVRIRKDLTGILARIEAARNEKGKDDNSRERS